jgi:hypothetical protein
MRSDQSTVLLSTLGRVRTFATTREKAITSGYSWWSNAAPTHTAGQTDTKRWESTLWAVVASASHTLTRSKETGTVVLTPRSQQGSTFVSTIRASRCILCRNVLEPLSPHVPARSNLVGSVPTVRAAQGKTIGVPWARGADPRPPSPVRGAEHMCTSWHAFRARRRQLDFIMACFSQTALGRADHSDWRRAQLQLSPVLRPVCCSGRSRSWHRT